MRLHGWFRRKRTSELDMPFESSYPHYTRPLRETPFLFHENSPEDSAPQNETPELAGTAPSDGA